MALLGEGLAEQPLPPRTGQTHPSTSKEGESCVSRGRAAAGEVNVDVDVDVVVAALVAVLLAAVLLAAVAVAVVATAAAGVTEAAKAEFFFAIMALLSWFVL